MVRYLRIAVVLLVVASFAAATLKEIDNIVGIIGAGTGGRGRQLGGCPLCDSSVYSYCSYKLAHDGCCCGGQYGIAIAPGCQYSDCQILYAKSCYEHHLIRRCCCENPYQK